VNRRSVFTAVITKTIVVNADEETRRWKEESTLRTLFQ